MSTGPVSHEIAHLAHAEMFTPDLDGSLWFFRTLLGMRETARQADSVYLRCYEDPYHHSLKLTAAERPGLGMLGWRTTSQDALERRAIALDGAGLGSGFSTGDIGVGRTYRFTSPDGHPMELVCGEQLPYSFPYSACSDRTTAAPKRANRPITFDLTDRDTACSAVGSIEKPSVATALRSPARSPK